MISRVTVRLKGANVKVIMLAFLIASSGCTNSTVTEENDTTSNYLSVDSLTYAQQRLALADDLQELRDSLDRLINDVRSMKKNNQDTTLNNALVELELNKDRVERDLQEINTTAENGWDIDNIDRVKESMHKVRIEYRRIMADAGRN